VAINPALLYANVDALRAKGFAVPVEDLGGGGVMSQPQLQSGMMDSAGAPSPMIAAAPPPGAEAVMYAPPPPPKPAPNQAMIDARAKAVDGIVAAGAKPAEHGPELPNGTIVPVDVPLGQTGGVKEVDAGTVFVGGKASAVKPLTLADKERAVLLPGQKESFENELEARKLGQVWDQAIADKQIAIATEQAAMEKAAIAEYEEKLRAEHEERARYQQHFDAEQAKLHAESEKIANTNLDPHRLFTGEKAWLSVTAAVVASVLGVFGARATNGRNAGVDAVQESINRDLELQARDIENKKGELGRKTNLLSQKYQAFGNMQQAKAAARIDGYKLAIAKGESYARQMGTEVAVLNQAKLSDALNRAIEREQEQFGIGIEARYQALKASEAKAASGAAASNAASLREQNEKDDDSIRVAIGKQIADHGGTHARVSPEMAQKYAAENPNKAPLAVGQLVWIRPDGMPSPITGGSTVTTMQTNPAGGMSLGTATAKSKDHAKEWEEVNSGLTDSIMLVDKAIKMREEAHGGKVFDQGAGESVGTALALKLKETAKNMSSDNDMKMLQKIAPPDVYVTHPVKGFLPGDDPTTTKLKMMKETLEQKKKINDATHLKAGQAETKSAPVTIGAPE
jgi:hypothetical protein